MRQQLNHIFIIVALPTFLSLGLLAFLLRDSLHDWAIERWSSDQYAFVESLAHDIDSDIKQATELLRVAAATDAFAALTKRKHIDLSINGIPPEHLDSSKRRVMEQLRLNGGFSVVFVLTPEGDHYISHPFTVQRSLKKYNLSDRPYFQQAKATRKLSISDSFTGADGVPAVAIDLPIVDAQGEIVMHLGGMLYLKYLSDFLAAQMIKPFDLAVLKDRKNQRIAESDASRLARPTAEPLLSYSSSANDIVKTTTSELSTYNIHTVYFSDGSGKRWFAYDATLSFGWQLMLFRSEAALNSIIAPQVRQLTLFAALIVLLPGLIGLGLASRFRRRWLDARNKLVVSYQMLEQRVAERTHELQRSETQYRTLFEANADGILILDGDRFNDCNPAAIKLFGAARRDDLLAHHPWELSFPSQPKLGDSKNAAQIAIKKALDDGCNEFEWRHRRLDDQSEFDARVLLSRIEIDGRVLIQASIRDITARKQAEESLRRAQKMKAVGLLTGGIAHDFNNILGIIMGNLDLLKHQVTDDKARKRVETIKGSAQRAADLTKQLLGFSRQQSAQRVRTDIRRVIREMESLIARSLTPEIAVEQQFAEDLWQTEIDPGNLQDALLNLAINARDAMPGGGILTLEARNCTLDTAYCAQNPGATPGEYVQLAVSDNGMGIAPEDRENIFEPFFTTKPQDKGTGLGLAMVYGFAKRSKGYIQVYSEPEIGTTFHLYLPRVEGEEQPQEATSESTERLPRGNETLLVVDDEEQLLGLAEESLLALGYRVLTAGSGRQAMERLAEEPGIDLLFSDVVMPGGMNGYELAEQATNAYPQLKVLLNSGYSDKARPPFAGNLLNKPYSQAELAQGVRTLLGESDMPEPTHNEPDRAPAQTSVEAIEWTDALSIGVDAIDADHKTLLALFNRCRQVMATKGSEQGIHSILDELSDYVQTHFKREEVVMAAVDYPGLENHRQVHRLLLKQVEKRRGQLKRGELSIGDLVAALLGSWLLDHIDNMDGAIKPYCEGKEDLIEQALEQAGMSREKEDQS